MVYWPVFKLSSYLEVDVEEELTRRLVSQSGGAPQQPPQPRNSSKWSSITIFHCEASGRDEFLVL